MRFRMLSAITVMSGMVGTATATTLTPLTLEEIAKLAPIAVVAEVAASPSAMAEGGARLATLDVKQAMWGTTEQQLKVALPGGTQQVGRLRIVKVMPGAPVMFKGTQFILFLQPTAVGNALEVVGFSQGMFSVTAGGQVQLPGQTGPLAVAEAVQRVRQIRADAAQPR